MNQRLIEGEVIDNGASELTRLRSAVDRLTRERDALREENADLQQRLSESDAPIARLREKLEPFYRLLQAMWGDLDQVTPETTPPATRSPVWESWKSRLGGKQAEFIETFLQHGEMSAAQLKAACKCSSDTVYQTIYKLTKAGLINKNGGRFSLKDIP